MNYSDVTKNLNGNGCQLSKLVDMLDPEKVFKEVFRIAHDIFPDFDDTIPRRVFTDTVKIFNGEHPGYRSCNTEYHNLKHTTDVLLAFARLVDGAFRNGITIKKESLALGFVSSMLHDIGYLQEIGDNVGTGAKHTLNHVHRGVSFIKNYFKENNIDFEEFRFCANMLYCTDLNIKVADIEFLSLENAIMGKMLGTADLLGQMADRVYLEKLLFLYYELLDGNMPGITSEIDLLRNTLKFYTAVKRRFDDDLSAMSKYMLYHFTHRWSIGTDLYAEGIEKNIRYLSFILDNHEEQYRQFLRRDGLVDKLKK